MDTKIKSELLNVKFKEAFKMGDVDIYDIDETHKMYDITNDIMMENPELFGPNSSWEEYCKDEQLFYYDAYVPLIMSIDTSDMSAEHVTIDEILESLIQFITKSEGE